MRLHPLAFAAIAASLPACASTPGPGPAPDVPATPTAPAPLLATLKPGALDESVLTTWTFTDGVFTRRREIALPEAPADWAWRGRGEIVLWAYGEDGAVWVVDVPRGALRELPQPPASAWVVPAGFVAENPDELPPEDYVHEVAVEVRGAEVWKGRCVDAYFNEGPRCSAYNWLRLDPPGTRTEVGMPAPPARPPASAPAPAGYTLSRVEQARPASAPEEVGSEPVPHVRCVGPDGESTFPSSRSDLSDDERYGTTVYEARDPRWLGHRAPLWTAIGEVPAMDTRPADFVFEGCSEAPLFGGEVSLVEGPTAPARWVALHSASDDGEWALYRDGVKVGTLPDGQLEFAPAP